MERSSLHVMCLAWHFPPAANPLAQRTQRTVSALAAAGHRVSVLTVDSLTAVEDGPGTPVAYDGVAVVRVPCPRDGLDPVVSRWEGNPLGSAPGAPSPSLWRVRADAAAYRLHRYDPVDLVVAVGPPYETFRTAFVLSVEAGVPFVLDDAGPTEGASDDPLQLAARRSCLQTWVPDEAAGEALRTRVPDAADRVRVLPEGWTPAYGPLVRTARVA